MNTFKHHNKIIIWIFVIMKHHPQFFNEINKGVLEKFKDEEHGHIITEVIALKPKM